VLCRRRSSAIKLPCDDDFVRASFKRVNFPSCRINPELMEFRPLVIVREPFRVSSLPTLKKRASTVLKPTGEGWARSPWDQTPHRSVVVRPSRRPSSAQQKGIRAAEVQRQAPPSQGHEFLAAPRRRSFAVPRKPVQADKDLNGRREDAVRSRKGPQTALGYSGRFA
jgi:hypothetical protein